MHTLHSLSLVTNCYSQNQIYSKKKDTKLLSSKPEKQPQTSLGTSTQIIVLLLQVRITYLFEDELLLVCMVIHNSSHHREMNYEHFQFIRFQFHCSGWFLVDSLHHISEKVPTGFAGTRGFLKTRGQIEVNFLVGIKGCFISLFRGELLSN